MEKISIAFENTYTYFLNEEKFETFSENSEMDETICFDENIY